MCNSGVCQYTDHKQNHTMICHLTSCAILECITDTLGVSNSKAQQGRIYKKHGICKVSITDHQMNVWTALKSTFENFFIFFAT